MPKWTAIIEGRELPARPLVLTAAGARPNDPTNSHMAVAKLKSLGFETRYDEPISRQGKWVKARYLDASAIVKLFTKEPDSDVVRQHFNAHPKPFHTTSLCLAEAFFVLKRKWLEKTLTTAGYLAATEDLRIAAWGEEIAPHDFGYLTPSLQHDLNAIVTTHHIDESDALQLLTILRGPHSHMVGPSGSVLITADRRLTKAAMDMGVRVWNFAAESAPEWA